MLISNPEKTSKKQPSLYNLFKNKVKKEEWVLIVDDNPFNILVMSEFLQSRGYKIVTAFNGKQAIEAVKNHLENYPPFVKILMDC